MFPIVFHHAPRDISSLSSFSVGTFVSRSEDGIIVADTNGLIIYANLPARHLLGFMTKDFIGRRMSDVLTPVLQATQCHGNIEASAESLTKPLMFTDVCIMPCQSCAQEDCPVPLDICMIPLTDVKGNKQGFGYIFTYSPQKESGIPNVLADTVHTPEYNWESMIIHDRGIILDIAGEFNSTFGYNEQSAQTLRGERINKLFSVDTLRLLGKAILSNDIGTKNGVALRQDGLLVPIEFRTLTIPCRGRGLDVIKIYAIEN